MSGALELLDRRLHTAAELKSVVHTMKTLAAVSIVPYENAVPSLAEYYNAVELGLVACLRNIVDTFGDVNDNPATERTNIIVFGSDQGMVGQFNEVLADLVLSAMKSIPGRKVVWPVGEPIAWRLAGAVIDLMPVHSVPDTVAGITPLTTPFLRRFNSNRKIKQLRR